MHTIAAHLRKEWLGQRTMLFAFVATAFVAFALGYLLAPETWFVDERRRTVVVAVFVMVGLAGGLVVLAPQGVRGEFTSKDDQFLRRLPGALWPAFAAKLLFMLLAGAALPLAGLLFGQGYLWLLGHGAIPLAALWSWDTGLRWLLPGYAVGLPWVFALTLWMPGARMGIGAAVLLALVLALAVVGVTQLHPGLECTLSLLPQLPWFAAIALLVAGVSFVVGRRGGDHRRSAKVGAVTLIVALLPQAAWFGSWVYLYRHPDLETPAAVVPFGLSADGAIALAGVAEHRSWRTVVAQIDLRTGQAQQLTPPDGFAVPSDLLQPLVWEPAGQRRYWLLADGRRNAEVLLDLETGVRHPIGRDGAGVNFVPPANLRAEFTALRAEHSAMRLPGGGRAFALDGELHLEPLGGLPLRFPLPPQTANVLAVGHGVAAHSKEQSLFFDLVHRRWVKLAADRFEALAVRGNWIAKSGDLWVVVDGATDASRAGPARKQFDRLLGLLDDDTVLVAQTTATPRTISAYRPATNELLPIALPDDFPSGSASPSAACMPGLRVQDPRGCSWLRILDGDAVTPPHGRTRTAPWSTALLTIDPRTLRGEWTIRSAATELQLLGFQRDGAAIVGEGNARLLRLEPETRAATVLFPRPR